MQVIIGEDVGETSIIQAVAEKDEGENSSNPAHPDLEVSRGAFDAAQMQDSTIEKCQGTGLTD